MTSVMPDDLCKSDRAATFSLTVNEESWPVWTKELEDVSLGSGKLFD